MANTVKFLGHATFEVVTDKGKRVMVDPWVVDNPACTLEKDNLQNPDLILITHDHFDHVGEEISELVGDSTIIVGQPEVVGKLKEAGIPDDNFIFGMGMNIGGTVEAHGIKVTMVQAYHSAEVGSPAGFVVTTEDGKNIYHAGDTGVFSDMKIIGELYPIDVALLPIGSVFVMDPKQAAYAVELLNPKKVVPMHYGTFPILEQDADEFVKLAKERLPAVEIEVLDPGEEAMC